MSSASAVLVFVGTRADLGPLAPVIGALAAASDLEPILVTGVAFDPRGLRDALPAALRHLEILALGEPLVGLEESQVRAHGSTMAHVLNEVLDTRTFSAAVVLGDRWELLSVVPTLFLAGVPVVHLHGGEVTEGAIDDRIRHAITKLADLHCVASDRSAARLRQLGESVDRITVTGAPGLDRYVEVEPATDQELERLLGRPVTHPLVLFTYHPVTLAPEGVEGVARHSREALEACLSLGGTVIATHPGMDSGRADLLAVLSDLAGEPRLVVVPALGRHYPVVLASCDVVVGNSSSGVIEAATAGVPAVDIGIRQLGRERGPNVVHSADGFAEVSAQVTRALALGRSPQWRRDNPYGDGQAAPRIVEVVRHAVGSNRQKAFIDQECS